MRRRRLRQRLRAPQRKAVSPQPSQPSTTAPAGNRFFGQAQEDRVIDDLLGHKPKGFYVDVGAHDPTALSNTKLFYDRGWTGINIEPDPAAFSKIAAARPRDINVNVAVSDFDGSAQFFLTDPGYLSSFNREDAERGLRQGGVRSVREISVPVVTLKSLLSKHMAEAGFNKVIDFMSIDTEGHEKQVLQGNDWSLFRPEILIVEYVVTGRDTTIEWDSIVIGNKYELIKIQGCNRIYRSTM